MRMSWKMEQLKWRWTEKRDLNNSKVIWLEEQSHSHALLFSVGHHSEQKSAIYHFMKEAWRVKATKT